MTTAFSQPDTGPLSWVMNEIQEALTQSATALQKLSSDQNKDQSTQLLLAKTYLHQAHGALQMVDISGVTILTEAVEELLDQAQAAQTDENSNVSVLSAEQVATIGQTYQALIAYLEELLAGAAHQPVKLFPYYHALMQVVRTAAGQQKCHPADLFFPDLSIRPQFVVEGQQNVELDLKALRKRFEMALLPFLKSSDNAVESQNAAIMQSVIGEVEQAQTHQQSRAFWWVMNGFSDGVANADIVTNEGNALHVKQLFARINLQLRRLSEGSSSISERLLRDALFFIAGIQTPSAKNQQIRLAYRLEGAVPADYQARHYDQVNPVALQAAKEHLTQAKNMWDSLASGNPAPAQNFEQQMHALSESGSQLSAPSLAKLLRELSGIARHAAYAKPGDAIGIEIATSLLFIENTLSHIHRLPENFSERADAMSARLLSVMSGETPTEPAHWLGEIYQAAQQRQNVKTLAHEMLVSLRQVEKMLDEYFSEPVKRTVLTRIDHVLSQIQGALSILDHVESNADAAEVITHTRATLQQFSDAEEGQLPEQIEFERIAQNIGALSFYLEMLQHQTGHADHQHCRLNFDEERQVFRINLLERTASTAVNEPVVHVVVPAIPVSTIPPAAEDFAPLVSEAAVSGASVGVAHDEFPALSFPHLPTIEEELLQHQQQAAELAISLSNEPQNLELQEQLKASLVQVRADARLSDDHSASDRAQAAIDLLAAPNATIAELVTAIVPAHTENHSPEITLSAPMPTSEEEADAELQEIFLTEADEVCACVHDTLPEARLAPHNQEHLTVLRRAFHTLKGSSRMIGLTAFGEAAWSIEQVLNLWLSEARNGTPSLYALLDEATQYFEGWIADIRTMGTSHRSAEALSVSAQQVRDGHEFVPAHVISAVLDTSDDAELSAELNAELTDEVISPAFIMQATEVQPSDIQLSEVSEDEFADAIALFASERTNTESPVIDLASYAENNVDALQLPSDQPQHHVESAEVFAFPGVPESRPDDSLKKIGELQISLPLYNIYLTETDQLVRLLARDFSEWRHEPERVVAVQAIHAAHSLAGSSATVGFKPLQELAHALEMLLQRAALQPTVMQEQDFVMITLAVDQAKAMLQEFAQGEMPYYEPALVSGLNALMHANNEPRKDDDEEVLQSPSPSFDNVQHLHVVESVAVTAETEPMIIDTMVPVVPRLFEQSTEELDANLTLRDDLDEDLLPVFIEEARDMLPQIGGALRDWQQSAQETSVAMPTAIIQAILRHLHTIKGSARMAGAMVLGQHMHEMESQIEIISHGSDDQSTAGHIRHKVEELLAHYDHGVQLFEDICSPQPKPKASAASTASVASTVAPVAASSELTSVIVPKMSGVVTAAPLPVKAPVQQVRVNADILDRLVNQAGEVSIARSRLESGVGTLQLSLSELDENVVRLREQLREIEMQAETQISSRMTQAGEREFDPLEFDRFTRLQELTRMMAESVNDVATLQKTLTKSADDASADLVAQGLLTRDLQQDLMHVRMVPFASVAERLYRLTRQVSKELDKRVTLDILGSTVEMDRGVLEKMVGPFEHLLRNAIVHGIETRDERRLAGKSDVGELKIEILQDGNEVLIQLTDDGQGLNLARIREKAQSNGLISTDLLLSDGEVTDLIFKPGFSTATEVTELAGRGVGMDVVRSEATSLGGRVAVNTEAGKGTTFAIHLPLTLAVTQVVIFSTGGQTYAVPSALVEQVQQLKAPMLAQAYNEGTLLWQGQRVPLHYLSALLGEHEAVPAAQQYTPIVILKSGNSANNRVALHVDTIVGNREVVVKNIGPQLSRMIGIVGATVLGSGDIVLILNPVPLAQRFAQEVRAPRTGMVNETVSAVEGVGAVAEMEARVIAPTVKLEQGLRTQKIVMVVDDSLTVRRVTQRLLMRESYQVVLAKDGVDALQQLQAITPDVMLVDIEMPRMDGFDLTRNIRSDERTRHIPIIMITSRTATKHRAYAMELGVNEYLGKPYQEDALLSAISGFMQKSIPA